MFICSIEGRRFHWSNSSYWSYSHRDGIKLGPEEAEKTRWRLYMANLLLEQVDYKIEETPRAHGRGMSIRVVDAMPNLRRGRRSSALPFSTIRSVSARRREAQDCQGIHSPGEKGHGRHRHWSVRGGSRHICPVRDRAPSWDGPVYGSPVAIGQLALALYFGLGQLATGDTAIGQLAYGVWSSPNMA